MLFSRSDVRHGRITIAGHHSSKKTQVTGLQTLALGQHKEALLYVPQTYSPDKPLPFVLLLHGAGGNATHGLWLLQQLAEQHQIILLAPSSQGNTWDIIEAGVFNLDVLFINQALEMVASNYTLDDKRFGIGGFSDGASYALSLGLINGALFTHIIAFSPGFFHSPTLEGKPKVYISHGTKDNVLPVQPCSRRIVPKLEKEGYDVLYREFNGGHVIPEDITNEAVLWFL
jgi:predicted esterase